MNNIYYLIDPINNKVRYVGNTKNPKQRYSQHLKDAEKSQNTRKQRWILTLKQNKMVPLMKIVETHPDDDIARQLEEKHVIKNIDTVFNLHMPGKGSKSTKHYKNTGKIN
jgi:predicted GIY-YIG superfamily endonuclease